MLYLLTIPNDLGIFGDVRGEGLAQHFQRGSKMAVKFVQFHTTQGDRFFTYSKSGLSLEKYFKTEKAARSWAAKNGRQVLSVEYI